MYIHTYTLTHLIFNRPVKTWCSKWCRQASCSSEVSPPQVGLTAGKLISTGGGVPSTIPGCSVNGKHHGKTMEKPWKSHGKTMVNGAFHRKKSMEILWWQYLSVRITWSSWKHMWQTNSNPQETKAPLPPSPESAPAATPWLLNLRAITPASH